MFDDETIRIACPQCGYKNQLRVREFERADVIRARCDGCRARLKIEARGFREHLERIASELEAMRLSTRESRRRKVRSGAIDFQI
jgi:formate dehydrogenase maturation protein FdhE